MTAIEINNTPKIITDISQLNFSGNIIPHTWFAHITFNNGKPDLLAMMILSEIIYWYRPRVVKNEHTGEFIGYTKKFKADKLQRSINSFSNQFGVSKRQAADALKRLDDRGFITRELRTIDTASGKIGNVLYIAPIVEKIAEIQSQPPLMQSNVIGGNEAIDVHPLGNQTHKGIHSNAQGVTLERSTYTESTTKTTTKNAAAAAHPIENHDRDNATPIAAAAVQSNDLHKDVQNSTETPPRQLTTVESLINNTLTPNQIHKIKTEIQIFKCDMDVEKLNELIEEICYGLLDPNCFSKTGNNFHRKLKAIINSIRNHNWEAPVSMAEKIRKQQLTEINQIKQEIHAAESQVNYCNEMIAFSRKYTNIDSSKFETEKCVHQQKVTTLKAQLLSIKATQENNYAHFN